jgi:hypothetical protein
MWGRTDALERWRDLMDNYRSPLKNTATRRQSFFNGLLEEQGGEALGCRPYDESRF